MSFLGGMKIGHRFGVLALSAAVAGALGCNVDREDVMFQSGDFVFDFIVDGTLAGGMPAGSEAITAFEVAAVDLTVEDAFARGTGVLGTFNSNNAFAFPAYSLAGMARNATTDTRLPTLDDADAAIGAFCVLGSPPFAGVGEGFWDLFCDVVNLKPNTRYTVMMVRYGLQVNGELDAAATLLGDPITAPDELQVLGGTPAGWPTFPCNFTVGVPVIRNANPLVLGFVDTDAAGATTIDCVPVSTSTDPTWWRNFADALPAGVEDSIPFSANTGVDGVDLAIPSYNYLVLVEGEGDAVDPVPAGPHAMRWQVGSDIDLTGAGINNAIGPYPDRPGTAAELLAGPGVAGKASGLDLTFSNLAALSGFVYQVWLWNAETGAIISPAGDWVATELDEEGNPVEVGSGSATTTFSTTADRTVTFTTSDAQAGQSIGEFTHAFVSIESAAAGSPSARQPLWVQFTDMAGAPTDPFQWTFNNTADMTFGSFGSGDEVPWAFGGIGEAGFWSPVCDDAPRCSGPSELLVVQYRNLQLPPMGYFYEGWLVDEDGNVASLGELVSFEDDPHVSLRDVDQDRSLTSFATDELLIRSSSVVPASRLGDGNQFADYAEFRLTLSPKARTGVMPPTTALGNVTPEPVRDRAEEGGS